MKDTVVTLVAVVQEHVPYHYNGNDSWEKPIDNGDRILVVGGRVGKDGIHGATFSSIEMMSILHLQPFRLAHR